MLTKYFFIILTSSVFFQLRAQTSTISWIGGESDSWHEAGNWSPKMVPTDTHDVVIDVANEHIIIDDSEFVEIASLQIKQGHLEVLADGGVIIDNELSSVADAFTIDGSQDPQLTNGGKIFITYAIGNGLICLDNAIVINTGQLSIEKYGNVGAFEVGINMQNDAQFENYGEVVIDSGAVAINRDGISMVDNCTFFNDASAKVVIQNLGGAGTNAISMGNITEFKNEGLVQLANITGMFGVFLFGGAEFINNKTLQGSNTDLLIRNSSGTFSGNGKVIGGLFDNKSIMSPGECCVGIIEIQDSFSITGSNSVINIQIAGGEGPGESFGHDLIKVSGGVKLDYDLQIDLLDGYEPEDFEQYTILEYTGALEGVFSNVSLPMSMSGWVVDYGQLVPGKVILRNPDCLNSISMGCGGPISSGLYRSLNEVIIECNTSIEANEEVFIQFQDHTDIFPGINGFDVTSGSLLDIVVGGCP